MNKKFILKEAIEDRYLLRESSDYTRANLYAEYATYYLTDRELRRATLTEQAALMMLSERVQVHPRILIKEGFWDSAKSMFGLGKKAAENADDIDPREAEYIADYLETQYSMVDRWKNARKQGATGWQSLKHAYSGLGSLYQQGEQVWSSKKAAKIQARAKMAFEDVKEQLASEVLEPMTKDFIKAIKNDESLGNPKKGGFPNNPKPEDFRTILLGNPDWKALQDPKNFKGIMGRALEVKETLQSGIEAGVVSPESAKAVMDKVVSVFQYYLGVMEDTYQSLENRNYQRAILHNSTFGLTPVQRLSLVINESLTPILDYPDASLLFEEAAADIPPEVEKALDKGVQQDGAIEAVTGGDESKKEELAAWLANPDNQIPDGLDPKKLENMKASSSVVKPLILAAVGAALTAIGMSMGGSAFGDFANSDAFNAMYEKVMAGGDSIKWTEIPGKVSTEVTDYLLPKGDGITQFIGRTEGLVPDSKGYIQSIHDGSAQNLLDIVSKKGISVEQMKTICPGWEKCVEALKANPTAKVGTLLKGKSGGIWATKVGTVKGQIVKTVSKKVTGQIVKGIGGTQAVNMLGSAAMSTFLATAGTATLASGLAVAALRKFAKSRKKMMLKCVEILQEPFQIQPDAPIVQVKPEESGLTPATDPDNLPDDSGIDMAGPTDKFDKSLELVYRALEKKGYKKEEAEKIMAVLFDPNDPFPEAREKLTNDNSEQENLMAHKAYKYSLGSLLFEEKLPYEEFEKFMKNGAKAAKVTEPNDEQIANAAVAFNLANGIGDITDLPKKAEKAEVNAELEDMKKKVSGLEEKLDDATEVKKKWMRQLVKQKTITKEQAKEIERLAGREATLEKVVESLQELAHRDGLQIRELEAAEAALQQQITAQQEEWSKKEEEMVNEISNLTAQIEAAKDSMDKAETLDILQLIVDENMKDLLDSFDVNVDPQTLLTGPEYFVEQVIGQINDKHAAELTKALEEKETELQAKLAEFENGQKKSGQIEKLYEFLRALVMKTKGNKKFDPFYMRKNGKTWKADWKDLENSDKVKFTDVLSDLNSDPKIKDFTGEIDYGWQSREDKAKNEKSKKQKSNESVRTTKTQDQLIMERWQKLAGLL